MLTISAPAKINLALDIISRLPNGYHEVDMVMQSITLADRLSFTPSPEVEITCDHPDLPLDERNLIWKAVKLVQNTFQIKAGVKIQLTKVIPIAAGLAGGSADAAATLMALNQIWKLGLAQPELLELGVKLGADVPFCIRQGTARARGIGERLTPIDSKLNCSLLLVTPKIHVATAWAYNQLQLGLIKYHPPINRIVQALTAGDNAALVSAWGNVLEEVVIPAFPEVARVKEVLHRFGVKSSLMSGSGPSVFCLNPPPGLLVPVSTALPQDWFVTLTSFQNSIARCEG